MSAPMNMEEWQRRMRAEKEAQRKKKTESAEILRGYRGGVNDEELKLRALREEERRKAMDAQNNLHNYKGITGIEHPKQRSKNAEVTNHPVPVNAGGSATSTDYWAGVDIVAGSVSERASALAAAADATGIIPSPTGHQSGVKASLLSDPSGMQNGSEAAPAEPNAQTQTQPEERSVLPPVKEGDVQPEEQPVIPAVEESVIHLEEADAALNSVPDEVDELSPSPSTQIPPDVSPNTTHMRDLEDEKKEVMPDLEDEKKEVIPSEMEPSVAAEQSKDVDTALSHADTKEQSRVVEDGTTKAPVAVEPEMEVQSAEENGPTSISDALEAKTVRASNQVEQSAASVTGLSALEVVTKDPDTLLVAKDAESMKPFATPSEGPKRTNVMFSFGVVSTQDRPDLFGYMKAVEKVICRCLENNTEGMRFDPKFRPFVKKTDPDGSFTPQSDRSDIKRTLVTAAVPVFFQPPATKASTKKTVVDALQRCIQSGEFLELAQAQ